MHSSSTELAAFARRLRSVRCAFAEAIDLPELSGAEFARMLGLPLAAYEAYEHGEREPSMSALVVLHRRTGVSIDWLIAEPQPQSRPQVGLPVSAARPRPRVGARPVITLVG